MKFPLFWLLIVAIVLAIGARAEENTTSPIDYKSEEQIANSKKKDHNLTNQQIQDWTNDLRGQPNTDCELIVTRYHRNCKIDLNSECTQELQNEYLKCNNMKLKIN